MNYDISEEYFNNLRSSRFFKFKGNLYKMEGLFETSNRLLNSNVKVQSERYKLRGLKNLSKTIDFTITLHIFEGSIQYAQFKGVSYSPRIAQKVGGYDVHYLSTNYPTIVIPDKLKILTNASKKWIEALY